MKKYKEKVRYSKKNVFLHRDFYIHCLMDFSRFEGFTQKDKFRSPLQISHNNTVRKSNNCIFFNFF